MAPTAPQAYRPKLDVRTTEAAILVVKGNFERHLSTGLNLQRVSAPPMVDKLSGMQDNLNGTERPVEFDVPDARMTVQMVQSLAKWKRWALKEYGFTPGVGLWTDMNAIRRDEVLDRLHSVYVDQWDWERVISPADRNLDFLRCTVAKIYAAMKATEMAVFQTYGLEPTLAPDIKFITALELEYTYPKLDRKERENRAARQYGAVFIIGIGAPLMDGLPHDGRAPDYDDWITKTPQGHGLNGDIVVWNPTLEIAFELSSMGIRVDKESLVAQLQMTKTTDRLQLPWHQMLMNDELPLSIGGGIGQSRLCMLLLKKAHIGEVQAGIWPHEMRLELARQGVTLL